MSDRSDLSLLFRVTTHCQLQCPHCDSIRNTKPKQPAYDLCAALETAFSWLRPGQCVSVSWFGGEPTLVGKKTLETYAVAAQTLAEARRLRLTQSVNSHLLDMPTWFPSFLTTYCQSQVVSSFDPTFRRCSGLDSALSAQWHQTVQELRRREIQVSVITTATQSLVHYSAERLADDWLQTRAADFSLEAYKGQPTDAEFLSASEFRAFVDDLEACCQERQLDFVTARDLRAPLRPDCAGPSCLSQKYVFNTDGTIAFCPEWPESFCGTVSELSSQTRLSPRRLQVIRENVLTTQCPYFQHFETIS